MTDLKRQFDRIAAKEDGGRKFYEQLHHGSRFIADVLAELHSQGFQAELDTERSRVKRFADSLEIVPVLKLRYQDKSLPENWPEKISFNIRVNRIAPQNGLSVALGLSRRQTAERIETVLPYIDERNEYTHMVCDNRRAVEKAASIVVTRFSEQVARHNEIETLYRNVDKLYRPRP